MSASLGPSLDAWRLTRWPESQWRIRSRKVIQDIVESMAVIDKSKVLACVDAAYPFGTREMLPYKMWLLERRLFRVALDGPSVAPTADEIGVCDVAGDLVQLGRHDEARKLLEQAPNRLARECPACGARPGRDCYAMASMTEPLKSKWHGVDRGVVLDVPHLARVGPAGRDDSPGPLFEGSPP